MPTYCYRADDADSACPTCADGFEAFQALSEEALTRCPGCDNGVHRVLSVASSPQCMTGRRWNDKKLLSDDNLRRTGFKKLVRGSDGKFHDVLRET